MNAPAPRIEIPTLIGTATEIGIFFGRIRVGSDLYAVFQPPMAVARHAPAVWNGSRKRVDDAMSFSDGHANTVAMAKAGSKVAQFALDHELYIPSLDESDLQYRLFKPGTRENFCWARSGINMNADPQLEPYTPDFPKQTELADYRTGGAEAFEERLHWTSTQYRPNDVYAWAQYFGDGDQLNCLKGYELPFVLVRRELIR